MPHIVEVNTSVLKMKLYGRFGNKQSGFTLIELAIVLIILGILVALGAALVGPLTKRSKYDESREVVKSAKEAVLGYVVKNGYLPADLETAGARKLDAWGNDLVLYRATEFDASGENACGVTATTLGGQPFEVRECKNVSCANPVDYNVKSNIGFIVFSKGPDANEAGTDPGKDGVPPFYVRFQDSTYTDGATTYNYDDIVAYASLDEIRFEMGCTGVTTTIPNPPTVVTATRSTLSSLNLTWTPPTTNTDASPLIDLVGYEIDRSLDGATYLLLQSIGVGSSFTDTSLVAAQRYFYRMRAIDKDGNESANSAPITSTTISPIRQTVAAAWSQPANEAACSAANAVPSCATAANRRKALFTIQNTGNAADNGANITVNSMVITWGTTGGTVKKIQAPDLTNRYCNLTGTASGSTTTLTAPLTINAGASTTMSIYWCTTGAQPIFVSVQFNTADGSFTLY